ncbi:MAG: recombination protein RecO [Sulfurovaceae bacterium]|nr:recombination protein RecO [Sulfurovaceae bacterium]
MDIRKAKNEDIIVTVLSNQSVTDYWRFFGARHSILQIGNFIDFEVEEDNGSFMPKIRKVSHLRFSWLFSPHHLIIWQNFIKLFYFHLKDTTEIEIFYLNLLLDIAQKWDKQNPKRLAVEAYLKLLNHEGRLYDNGFCYVCEEPFNDRIGLMRAYIPAHSHCIYTNDYKKNHIFTLFDTKSTIHIENNIVDELYTILLKGL